ncbi:MAG: AAA family ATPase [Isosphaeraceae bacterium]
MLLDCLRLRRGAPQISREDLVEIVNSHGEIATRIVEKLADVTSAYAQFSELRWPYVVLMRHALLDKIRQDNVVYHGYSGHLLVPVIRHFVRIRIDAPFAMRVQLTMKRLDCDEDRARKYIAEVDEQRIQWARFMYSRDIRNPMLYAFHLNLGQMSTQAACDLIEFIMNDDAFQATDESRAEVERLYRSSYIEAALVSNPATAQFEISAEAGPEEVRLTGPYLDEAELEAVKETALTAAGPLGISKVEYRFGYENHFDVDLQSEILEDGA